MCLIMPLRVSVLQGVYSDVVFWCYSEGKGIISKLVDLLVKGLIAQWLEHLVYVWRVLGSIPSLAIFSV